MKLDYAPKICSRMSSKIRQEPIRVRKQLIEEAREKQDIEKVKNIEAEIREIKAERKKQSSLWVTPNTPDYPVLYLVSQALGGQIGVDVTADDGCLVPARHHITKEDNFLHSSTDITGLGPAYMNCPYANPRVFLEKLAYEFNAGHCNEAIALCKQGVLANQGSGALISERVSAACIWGAGKTNPLTGKKLTRLAFIDPNGFLIDGTDFDCVFLYFGVNPTLFIDTFKPYGSIWIPA